MKQYTKEMIRRTFVKQLNEHPFSKVTVKSIVEECEMNRNTFYYHYADIYEVLAEVFETELEKVVNKYSENASWEECFNLAVKSALDNKAAVYHIYNSIKREELEKYIFNIAGTLMNRLVINKSQGIEAKEQDIHIVAKFLQCALTQMVISWIAGGMLENPYELIERIGRLFDGSIERALERSAEDKKTDKGR